MMNLYGEKTQRTHRDLDRLDGWTGGVLAALEKFAIMDVLRRGFDDLEA
jgi:hypothetical protein